MGAAELPTATDIAKAREAVAGVAIRTPLVRLNIPDAQIYLKLENLQPIGSFKLRGAAAVLASATAAPLAASLAAGGPATVDMQPSFVDGIGSRTVLPSMYDRATQLGITSLVAPVTDVAAALRLLLDRNRVLAEGAGATPVACALSAGFGPEDVVVCVVSGGVIGLDTVRELMI